MAEYDYTRDMGGSNLPAHSMNRRTVLHERFTLQTLATALTDAGYFAAADIINLWDLPAGVLVERLVVNVVTAEASTMTLDFGVGGDDQFEDGVNAESTGYTGTAPDDDYGTATGKTWGHLLTSADTIDMCIKTLGAQVAHTAVIDVTLCLLDCRH